jgi:hypothetical protein
MLLNEINFNETKEMKVKIPVFKFKKPIDDIDKSIQCFLSGKTGKFGKYFAVENALVYRTIITTRHGDQKLGQNIIALRISRKNEVLFIGNSSILPLIGRNSAWGRESLNSGVSEVQTRLSRYIQMIPFSVFVDAGLDLTKIEILDKGEEKTVIRTEERYNSKTMENEKIDVEVHFTGASLFKVENRTFLFDLDQRELKYKIFNAFLVELNVDVLNIQNAYESLKPNEVKEAEKQGLEVLRQGEWFFIPVQGEFNAVPSIGRRLDGKGFEALELRAGNNRPNYVEKYCLLPDKTHVVTGLVTHSGREHKELNLKGWYKAIPNTSIQSFTLRGDID